MSTGPAIAARNPVEKAVQLLRWMVDDKGTEWGVREVARGMGLAPSTVHRVLTDLEAQQLVRADANTGRYSLGLEFFRLAWKGTRRFPLRQAAIPALQRLVEQTNETAFLGVYDRDRREMMFAAAIESAHELRYVVTLNKWMPLYLGSSGLAILAFLPERDRSAILGRIGPADKRTSRAKSRAELNAALAEVRRLGYARTMGERVPGAVGISAPVFGSGGDVVADIGLSIPVQRFSEHDEGHWANHVRDAARQVTNAIGGIVPDADSSVNSSISP
ncbi:MAG: IclR family transcriptional regulator [Candidatus Dormibacteraceae bacterium]